MKTQIRKFFPILLLLGFACHTETYAVKHIVHVANFAFNPSSLNVTVGDTIRWQWDSGNHTTTSGVIPAAAASWDQPINSANPVYEYPVTAEGVYHYVCTFHEAMGMIATFTANGAGPTLSVTPSNQNVPSSSGSTTFSVTSNSAWTVTSNATWCTVNPGGTGNGTITASYSLNTTFVQRVATLSVSVTGLPVQNVTVTQAAATRTLSVTPPSQSVPATAGTTTFNVTSNTTWTAVCDSSWCSVTPSGNGNGILTATYAANTTTSIRIATISVSVTGLPVLKVTVVQAAGTADAIQNQDQNLTLIYPNPSSGLFKVALGNITGIAEISILDISGKTITSERVSGSGEVGFDLSTSPKGYYFVRLKTGTNIAVRRIIID